MPFTRSKDEQRIAIVALVLCVCSVGVGIAGWWYLLSIWLGALLALVTACSGLMVLLFGVYLWDSCRRYEQRRGVR